MDLILPLSKFTEAELEVVKEKLTMENPAYVNYKKFKTFGVAPNRVLVYYSIYKDNIIVPRNINLSFTISEFVQPLCTTKISAGKFNGKLLDFQDEVIQKFKLLEDKPFRDVILEMPCGHGKTITSLFYTSQVIKAKTLVVVPTLVLAKQWVSKIKEFLPEHTVSMCENPTDDFSTDYFVINIDRLVAYSNKFPDEFWKSFACTVFDEAHRDGAYTYLPMISRFNPKYCLALTATFRRRDMLHEILRYYFGEVFTVATKFKKATILPIETGYSIPFSSYVLRKNYRTVTEEDSLTGFTKVLVKKTRYDKPRELTIYKTFGKWFSDSKPFNFKEYASVVSFTEDINFAKLDSEMTSLTQRNKMIISLLNKLLAGGRRVLFISKRKEILIWLYEYYLKRGYAAGLLVGSKSSKALQEQEKALLEKYGQTKEEYLYSTANIVFGISQLVNEGFDAPRLDTLILHTPVKDSQQAVGRVERYYADKKFPLFIALIDKIFPYRAMYKASLVYMRGSKVLPTKTFSEVISHDYLVSLFGDYEQ